MELARAAAQRRVIDELYINTALRNELSARNHELARVPLTARGR